MTDDLMTVEEASGVLRLSKSFTFRIIQNGNLNHYRVGKRILISRSQIEEFLQKHLVAGRET